MIIWQLLYKQNFMKKLFILTVFFIATALTANAQTATKLKVAGNCGMCKSSIEKAAKSAGATSANWDEDAKILTLLFDSKTSLEKIETAISAVGYDTEHKKASKASYDALHECCKYDRASDSSEVPAEIKKVSLVASGLTCSMCSKAIFKALSKLDFVEEVKVDIEKSMYIMTFKAGKKVDLDQIKLAVTDAGFGVQSLVYE